MNFYDKITGNDMTRQQKEFNERLSVLPTEYQDAWNKINSKIWQYSNLTGRNLMPILDGILNLFEEGFSDGLSIQEIVGDNLDDFVASVTSAEGAKSYRDKLRQQLNSAVAKRLLK